MDALSERVIRTDITMQVAAREGQIHLLFDEKNQVGESVPAYTANFVTTANDALTLSSLLADLAFEVDSGLKIPEAMKKELVARHRVTLLNRIRVVLNSTRETKVITNQMLAQQLVDLMSAEVFS